MCPLPPPLTHVHVPPPPWLQYPHVATIYWVLYRLARVGSPPLPQRQAWSWYLKQAVSGRLQPLSALPLMCHSLLPGDGASPYLTHLV